MRPTVRLPVVSALTALLLLASACSDDHSTAPTSSTDPSVTSTTVSDTSTDAATADDAGGGPGAMDEMVDDAVASAAEGYERTIGAWTGFDPREHPTVVSLRADGDVSQALAINHPNAGGLGTAVALDTNGTPFDSLHLITDLDEATKSRLQSIENFDFTATLGEVDAFVMVADRGDAFLDPASNDWPQTLIHEMFHRYQFEAFADDSAGQDIDGYAYTQENLELAALEERALRAAVLAGSDSDRETAARHLAGLRLARLAADHRVELDLSQERYEGTARYLEHVLGGDDERFGYRLDNFAGDLLDGFTMGHVKDDYGFGRFYASGAAIMRVLDQLDVADVIARVEAGESPIMVLADHLGVGADDAAALVDEARVTYGDAALEMAAAEAETSAAGEPSFWGDETAEADGADGGEAVELTDEQIECLDAAEIPADGVVPDEVWEACVGA